MRHVLTASEKARGLKAALRSPRTPDHLRPFIRQRLRELQPAVDRERAKTSRPKRKPGLLDWLF